MSFSIFYNPSLDLFQKRRVEKEVIIRIQYIYIADILGDIIQSY